MRCRHAVRVRQQQLAIALVSVVHLAALPLNEPDGDGMPIASAQVTPIFASAKFRDGGLGLKPSELALPMAAGGIMLTLFALLIYPRVQPRLGMLWTCRLGLLIMVPTALLVPSASLFVSSGPWQPGSSPLWPWRDLLWAHPRRWRWHRHWHHRQHHQSDWQYIESQVLRPTLRSHPC